MLLVCRGNGLEPDLHFDRNLVAFGPVLPHSAGDEQEVVIRNPCAFPIEIYNLEFDKTYLEEEKVSEFKWSETQYVSLTVVRRYNCLNNTTTNTNTAIIPMLSTILIIMLHHALGGTEQLWIIMTRKLPLRYTRRC